MMRPNLPGFRFIPSDSELIHHLAQLLGGGPIAEDLILALNVYTMEPGSLPVSLKYSVGSEAYYFTQRARRHGGTGKRTARRAGAGTWKSTGSGTRRPVRNEHGKVVGHVMRLTYCRDNEKASSKWVMDEYRLAGPQPPEKENWAICRIKLSAATQKRIKRKEKGNFFPGDQMRCSDAGGYADGSSSTKKNRRLSIMINLKHQYHSVPANKEEKEEHLFV